MSDELDSMADIIQTFKITPEEIVEKTIPSSELYELKVGSQVLTPFWVETLKKQIESGSPLFTPEIEIRALGTEEWFGLFTHPAFQEGQEERQTEDPCGSPCSSRNIFEFETATAAGSRSCG